MTPAASADFLQTYGWPGIVVVLGAVVVWQQMEIRRLNGAMVAYAMQLAKEARETVAAVVASVRRGP